VIRAKSNQSRKIKQQIQKSEAAVVAQIADHSQIRSPGGSALEELEQLQSLSLTRTVTARKGA